MARLMAHHDNQCFGLLRRGYRIWVNRTGVDWNVWKLLFKGAIAPTICLACYETKPWQDLFTSLGYLTAMSAIIAMPSLPRAKHIQLLLLDTVATCFGAALTALALFTVMKARESTSGYTTEKPVPYNSSASAVAGVWLVVQTYFVSAVRASHPRFIWPCSAWLIFVVFGPIYAPSFGTMDAAMIYTRRLLLSVLVGLGIGSGVSLLIFPLSTRTAFFESVQKSCAQIAQALRTYDFFLTTLTVSEEDQIFTMLTSESDEIQSALETTKSLSSLFAKLDDELKYARQEFSYGHLNRHDLATLQEHLRAAMIPLIGLGQLPNMFSASSMTDFEAGRTLVRAVHQTYRRAITVMADTIEHVPAQLGLGPEPLQEEDVKKSGDASRFSASSRSADGLRQLQKDLLMTKQTLLETWNGLPSECKRTTSILDEKKDSSARSSSRQQLDLLLFAEVLLYAVAMRLENLVRCTDQVEQRRRTIGKRFLFPGMPELWEIFSLDLICPYNALRWHQDSPSRPDRRFDRVALKTRWERNTAFLPAISQFFRSDTATFAIRVTLANISIGIVAFLHYSQNFYISQHIVWGNYAVGIAMMPSVGQSFKFFLTRLLGTILGIILAWISWYIVAGVPAGALVIYGVLMHIPMYILLQSSEWANAGSVSAFAFTVVFGYQILVQAYGASNLEEQGLAAHPTYLEGAIRLAAISVGLLMAWFWTIFPYVVSEARLARQRLGELLYSVSEYYYTMHKWDEHTHIEVRPDSQVDISGEEEWASLLSRQFARCTSHGEALQALLKSERFEVDFGRRFPREEYAAVTEVIGRLVDAIELAAFTSASFTRFVQAERDTMSPEWIQMIHRNFQDAKTSAETVPTLLAILSNFIATQAPLPPHLRVPQDVAFGVREQDHSDVEIFDVKHAADPGFATLTVMYLVMQQMNKELILIIEHVKNILGEIHYDPWTHPHGFNQG